MSHEKKLLIYLTCIVVLHLCIRNTDAVREVLVQGTGNKPWALDTNHWLREHVWAELRALVSGQG
jgi:hypothetical protein